MISGQVDKDVDGFIAAKRQYEELRHDVSVFPAIRNGGLIHTLIDRAESPHIPELLESVM